MLSHSTSNKPSVLKVAIASGFIHVGNALGGIIPACFFAEQYMNEWIARGQKPDQMLEMVKGNTRCNGEFFGNSYYVHFICHWCIHWLFKY